VKNLKKITAFILCVMLVFALGACAPKGATADKEWGFRANGKEYAVGTYLLPLADAYESVYGYLGQVNKDFDPSKSILDLEASFDESGKVYSAREWILKQASDYIKYMVAVDSLMQEYDVKLQEGRDSAVYEQARNDWFLGKDYQNVIDGYAEAYPVKDKYEPLGISVESYCDAAYMLDVKYDAIFARLYSKGGEREVTEAELNSYFEKNYVDYSYFIVRLYEASYDEVTGELVNTPYSDAQKKEVLDKLNMYPIMAKEGKSLSDIKKKHIKDFELQSSDFMLERTERLEDVSVSASSEIADILNEIGESQAKVIVTGQGDTPVALVVYKSPIKDETKKYLSDDINYRAIVADYKGQEFFEFLASYADKVEVEINWDVLNAFSLEFIEKNFKSYIKRFEF